MFFFSFYSSPSRRTADREVVVVVAVAVAVAVAVVVVTVVAAAAVMALALRPSPDSPRECGNVAAGNCT